MAERITWKEKRNRGRQKTRWKVEIRKFSVLNSSRQIGGRDEWKGLGTAFCPAVSWRCPLKDDGEGGARSQIGGISLGMLTSGFSVCTVADGRE